MLDSGLALKVVGNHFRGLLLLLCCKMKARAVALSARGVFACLPTLQYLDICLKEWASSNFFPVHLTLESE